jgi:hypothetical protein
VLCIGLVTEGGVVRRVEPVELELAAGKDAERWSQIGEFGLLHAASLEIRPVDNPARAN